jgi:hypothetical protein
MKYYQSGGGYFADEKTLPDQRQRIKARKRYLRHCENVVKDNDVGSRDYLITQLKLDVDRAIKRDYKGSPLLERIKADKKEIFRTCDEWMNTHTENCLMTVNVVSLQIVILFTYACLDYKEPTVTDDWKYFGKDINIYFPTIIQNGNWKTFKHTYNYFTRYASSRIKKYLSNVIITVLDRLFIDKIMEEYLNGWYTCQIVYKKKIVDREELLPFEFVWHDFSHYNNFLYFLKMRSDEDPNYTIEILTKFYNFINEITSGEQKDSVKMILFLSIHESTGRWFEDKVFKGNLADGAHELYNDGYLWIEQFDSEDEFLLLIPKKYRPPDRRVSYLNTALANYLYVLEEFKKKLSIKYESLDTQRLERVKDMMSWEKHRPIPELLLYTEELESLGCYTCTTLCCVSGGTRNKKRKNRKHKTRKYLGTSAKGRTPGSDNTYQI